MPYNSAVNPQVDYVNKTILVTPERYTTEKLRSALEHPETIQVNMQGEMAWVTHRLLDKEYIERYRRFQLQDPCFAPEEEDWNTQVVLAPPVLIALMAGFYDLVDPLLEAGFGVTAMFDNVVIGEQTGEIVTGGMSFSVKLGEYLLDDPNMPDDLRLRLWDRFVKETKEGTKTVQSVAEIDFSTILLSFNGVHEQLFKKNASSEDECPLQNQMLKSFRLFIKERPGFLLEITSHQWPILLKRCIGSGFARNLAQLLLDELELSKEQKKEILNLYHGVQKIVNQDSFMLMGKENILDMVEEDIQFYRHIAKYYQEDAELKKFFAESLLYLCIRREDYCNDVCDMFGKKDDKLYSELVKVVKEYLPKEYGLDSFMCLQLGDQNICSMYIDMNVLIKTYRKIVGGPIRLDNKISFADWCKERSHTVFEAFHKEMPRDEEFVASSPPEHQWLGYVDEFCFDDNSSLNSWQKVLLLQESSELLELAISRGLFSDQLIEEALRYCLKRKETYGKIPCIIAHSEKPTT